MAQARREQARMAMLPHLAGKFDRERFVRTGGYIECKAYPLPDTPAIRAAREELEREQAAIAARRAEMLERMRNGG